jgi:hypothetical protein
MKRFSFTYLWGAAFVVAAVLVMGSATARAGGPANVTVNPVFNLDDDFTLVEGATSTLIRTDNGISMVLTTGGLAPGAYTIWFIVFNDPEACFNPPADDIPCGDDPADFEVGNPARSGFTLATGHIVDDSGEATFAGHLNVGDLLLNNDLELDEVLENARTAEVHLIVRFHGEADPGRIHEQLRTGEFDDPSVVDVQFAVNPAP